LPKPWPPRGSASANCSAIKNVVGAIRDYLDFHAAVCFRRPADARLSEAAELFAGDNDLFRQDLEMKHAAFAGAEFASARWVELFETQPQLEAVFLYRCSRAAYLRDPEHPSLLHLARLMKLRTGAEIYFRSVIGPALRIVHSAGIVIGANHTFGSHLVLYQNVTVGNRHRASPHEIVSVGDRCSLYAGCALVGKLSVGDDVHVAANAVLLQDAESNSTYAGIPARRVR
jgi:serine acetyltransferase